MNMKPNEFLTTIVFSFALSRYIHEMKVFTDEIKTFGLE